MNRRGACPTLSQPMRTGDGLLVRLSPAEGGLTPAAFVGLAEAAAEFGNGLVDVSARGNFQLRGLRDDSIAPLAKRIEALGILLRNEPAIEINPLAGLSADSQSDPRALALAIRRLLSKETLRLSPKLSIVIDGGGALHLDALDADIRLLASGDGWVLSLGGDGGTIRPWAMLTDDQVAAAIIALLRAIAANGPDARARVLPDHLFESVVPRSPTVVHLSRSAAQPIGRHQLRDGTLASGFGLPFGQILARDMAAFGQAAIMHAAREIRPALGRILLVSGLEDGAAGTLDRFALGLGLIVDPADPRHKLHACVGRPACSSATIAARQIAADIARGAGKLLAEGIDVHVSGCVKGCAHPGRSTLALVGAEDGCGIILDGTPSAQPVARLTEAEIPAFVSRLAASHPRGRPIEPPAVTAALPGNSR